MTTTTDDGPVPNLAYTETATGAGDMQNERRAGAIPSICKVPITRHRRRAADEPFNRGRGDGGGE